jgi:hypothetical protein
MLSLRAVVSFTLSTTFVLMGLAASAQTTADIQKTFGSKYALTKATANHDDIVTAGDVIVLQKDGLVMVAVSAAVPAENTYKNGKISQTLFGAHKSSAFGALAGHFGQTVNTGANRTFVSGEKFWITSVDVKEDGVVFGVFSDAINDVRYYGTLKIPFNKGQQPPAADLAAQADQVFKVQPADNGGDNAKGSAPGTAAPAAAAIPPPAPVVAAVIAPPPPPPPDPIQIGQTKAAVSAAYGEPTKVIFKSATKEIDAYPGLKVTFVHDKVTDVE